VVFKAFRDKDGKVYYQDRTRRNLRLSEKRDIIQRQGGKCAHCDYTFNFTSRPANPFTGEIYDYYSFLDVEFHHIIPVSQEGKTILGNMEALCFNCHTKETAKLRCAKKKLLYRN